MRLPEPLGSNLKQGQTYYLKQKVGVNGLTLEKVKDRPAAYFI